jgi:hypothetical protein
MDRCSHRAAKFFRGFLLRASPVLYRRGGWALRRPSLCGALWCLALLLPLSYAWLHSRDCTAPPVSAAPSLPPIPPHTRSASASSTARLAPAAPAPAQLDVIYVSGFPQQLQSSLRSLCQFMDPVGVGRVHIIVPDRMASYFEASVPQLQCEAGGGAAPLRFRVWPESSLVPPFTRDAPHAGTQRQMALKLAAAFIVDTPFYLVMDSDVYARRPFGVGDLLLRDGAGVTRARTGLDQLDFPQRASWFQESAALLETRLVADTDAFCAGVAGGGAQWFVATGNASVPAGAPPFALLPQRGPRVGALVYGACRDGRGHATHVTPMVLSREVVREVVVPRLEAVAAAAAAAAAAGGGGGGAPEREPAPSPPLQQQLERQSPPPQQPPRWYDALLGYHTRRHGECWQGLLRKARFYSWTEYALYFVAGVAAGALDQYHAFDAGPVASYKHSVMTPEAYDAMDWDAVFRDRADDAPFFIVHSWFDKPLATTHLHLGKYIKGLPIVGAEASQPEVPSPLPFWR